jgi:hypothetical protein
MSDKQPQKETPTTDPNVEQMFREATIQRYEHGGGRVFWEGPDGRRQLLIDLYGAEDGAIREYVLRVLGWAPDLLEALRAVRDWMDNPELNAICPLDVETASAIRVAVAKAEGRS